MKKCSVSLLSENSKTALKHHVSSSGPNHSHIGHLSFTQNTKELISTQKPHLLTKIKQLQSSSVSRESKQHCHIRRHCGQRKWQEVASYLYVYLEETLTQAQGHRGSSKNAHHCVVCDNQKENNLVLPLSGKIIVAFTHNGMISWRRSENELDFLYREMDKSIKQTEQRK